MDWEEQLSEEPGESPARPEDLLLRLTIIGILVPLTAMLVIWIWGYTQEHHFTNKEIRFLCLIIWAGTLVILAISAIGGRHGSGSRNDREGRLRLLVPIGENQTTLQKWEQRSSRQLLYRATGSALAVPAISFIAIWVWANMVGVVLTSKMISQLAPFLWGGGIAACLIVSIRSTRGRLLYKKPSAQRSALTSNPPDDSTEELF